MTNKTKAAIASGAVAVGIATASFLGLNVPDESTQSVTTPVVETYEETETAPTVEETEEETQALNNEETEVESDNPLLPYRRTIEKDGVLIYYYENVPDDLKPLLISSPRTTFSLRDRPVAVEDSDISIMDKYVFVQSEVGMIYLSQITHGIVEDERITDSTLKGYSIFLNRTIECYDWLPFKDFAGIFFGNGNALYVMSVADGDVTLTIDNAFAENFTGELSRLTIICNSPTTSFIENALAGKLTSVNFEGEVTYLIKNATNCLIDDCGIYIKCNSAICNATGVKITNTIIENEMTCALIETAYENCVVDNNIISSIIQGEPGFNCGAFVGTLKAEMTLKNNLSQCIIDVPLGYGGHAIGYADYDYQETENIFGNYFESSLTVEGVESDLFIGNIDIFKITAALESLEEPFDPTGAACSFVSTDGNTVTTVYNLGLFPSYWFLDSGQAQWEQEVEAYNTKLSELKSLEQFASSTYEGFYTIIDVAALNQDSDVKIYEEDGKYYFEREEVTDELAITNITYSDGNMIIFFNQPIANKTAIISTYYDDEAVLASMYCEQISGETVFIDAGSAPEGITTIKIMIWDDMENMVPACNVYKIDYIQ